MTRSRHVRNLKLGVKSLMLHKLRSLLTMLGVVFGVASVIAMLAIGEGSKRHALEQIERLGTNNVIVNSRKPVGGTGIRGAQSRNSVINYGILYADQERVEETIPYVQRTVPIRRLPKLARVGDQMIQIDVIGTTPAWFDMIKRDVIAGRVFNQVDSDRLAPVIVLTEQLARRLLVRSHTIGEQVILGD